MRLRTFGRPQAAEPKPSFLASLFGRSAAPAKATAPPAKAAPATTKKRRSKASSKGAAKKKKRSAPEPEPPAPAAPPAASIDGTTKAEWKETLLKEKEDEIAAREKAVEALELQAVDDAVAEVENLRSLYAEAEEKRVVAQARRPRGIEIRDRTSARRAADATLTRR